MHARRPKKDLLQTIPAELRLLIYDMLMPLAVKSMIRGRSKLVPAYLQTSDLLRREALTLWLRDITSRRAAIPQEMMDSSAQVIATSRRSVTAIGSRDLDKMLERAGEMQATMTRHAELLAEFNDLRLLIRCAEDSVRRADA